MEIKNAAEKESRRARGGRERRAGTSGGSSRIPGYSPRAWKTIPPSRRCALRAAPMNFHENYVRIFIPFLLHRRPPSPSIRTLLSGFGFLLPMSTRVSGNSAAKPPFPFSRRRALISNLFNPPVLLRRRATYETFSIICRGIIGPSVS